MKFYRVLDEAGEAQWLVVRPFGDHRIFGWWPLTQDWRRNYALEEQFFSITPTMTFELLEKKAMKRAVKRWPFNSFQEANWLSKELALAEALTVKL